MKKFQEGDIIGLKNPPKGYENHIGRVTRYSKLIHPDTFECYEQPFIEWITPSFIYVWDTYSEDHLRLVERPQLTLDLENNNDELEKDN